MNPQPDTVDSVTSEGIVAVIAAVLLVIVAGVPLNVTASITFASPPLPPVILIFPEPNKDSLFIVLILVPDTKVGWAPTSAAVEGYAGSDTIPLDGLYAVVPIFTCVTVPVFDVFEFQLVISADVMLCAGEFVNIGSNSIISSPGRLPFCP